MYDRKRIRFIKKNFTYWEYIRTQGLDYEETGSDSELRICCPKCDETDYKCYVNDDKKVFICHKCDFGRYGNGDVFDFVAQIEGITAAQALARIYADYREVTPDDVLFEEDEEALLQEAAPKIRTISSLPLGTFLIDEEDDDAQPYIAYLLGRGFTLEDIHNTQAHYTLAFTKIRRDNGNTVKIGNRVLWPIYGGNAELVSWLTRQVVDTPGKKSIKYINCPDSDMAKTVWPYVPLPPNRHDAVVCEGLIDSLSIRRAGYYSYAAFGKKLSEEQLQLLIGWGVTSITLFFDKDATREVIKLAEEIKMRFSKVFVVDTSSWPEKQDSGSLLTNDKGSDIIRDVLDTRVDVYDEFAYARWRLTNNV